MKILVTGNCQARPVAELLSIASDDIEITGVIIVHLAKKSDITDHEKLYEEADVILAQPVKSDYPVQHVSSEYIKEKYAHKTVTWINVFFHGQSPDLFYLTPDVGDRVLGPLDVYHSRALLDLWKLGIPAKEIDRDTYISRASKYADLQRRVDKSFMDLQARESGVDIKIGDFICAHWQRVPLFHTFNHPNLTTLIELGDRICTRIGLPMISDDKKNKLKDRLSIIVPPMESSMAENLGIQYSLPEDIHGVEVKNVGQQLVKGGRKVYQFDEFVAASFDCYDLQTKELESFRYTPE